MVLLMLRYQILLPHLQRPFCSTCSITAASREPMSSSAAPGSASASFTPKDAEKKIKISVPTDTLVCVCVCVLHIYPARVRVDPRLRVCSGAAGRCSGL